MRRLLFAKSLTFPKTRNTWFWGFVVLTKSKMLNPFGARLNFVLLQVDGMLLLLIFFGL